MPSPLPKNEELSHVLRNKIIFLVFAAIVITIAGAAVINSNGLKPDIPTEIVGNGLKPNIPTAITLQVKDYSAKGDGVTDDTTAIQNAIDDTYAKGGGTVFIPDGTYLVNPDVSINMKNNTRLNLSDNAALQATATSSTTNAVVKIKNITDVEVVGGKIIGDRVTHTGTKGEWGMGIELDDSSNISISNISISNCWGDGIYAGSNSESGYNSNVIIENFKIDNCRRNGISIISVKGLTINNGVISNTNGTDPQCGIDLEPNYVTEYMQNVLIENVQSVNNAEYGLLFGYDIYRKSTIPSDVTVKNFVAAGNGAGTYNDWKHYVDRYCHITIN